MTKSLLYTIALTFVHGVGDQNAKSLISYCGSAEQIFKSTKATLLKIPGIGETTIHAIQTSKDVFGKAEKELLFMEKHGIHALTFLDAEYPNRLKMCADSPLVLYAKGTTDLNATRMVSIVGTRSATEYGKEICQQFVKDLAAYKAVIVSGLAYGIDYQAHKTSLQEKATTIGVLGHSLDRMYPPSHLPIATKMIENGGGLLSECSSGTKADRQNFPRRNRIIAGMCDATIVIETAQKGGSIITAQLAHAYHRDVFAVPGRIGDRYSSGCNELIKKNMAGLITSINDLAKELGWLQTNADKPKAIQKSLFIEMSAEEKKVVASLENVPSLHIDGICRKTQYSISKVSAHLLSLEFKGVVRSLPGSQYKLC